MTNTEQALALHKQWNGKLDTTPKCQVKSREDLAIAYTPGVAEPCKAIAQNKEEAYQYTIKSNTIAVISDGSAVLGLGNIGAEAAMPVMEGKASPSVWIRRIRKKLYAPSSTSHLLSAALTWKIFLPQGVLKSKPG